MNKGKDKKDNCPKSVQHCIDSLQLYGYVGAPIDDVIGELQALKRAAKTKQLSDLRVLIGPRDNMAQLDELVPVNPKLRMFVVGHRDE